MKRGDVTAGTVFKSYMLKLIQEWIWEVASSEIMW